MLGSIAAYRLLVPIMLTLSNKPVVRPVSLPVNSGKGKEMFYLTTHSTHFILLLLVLEYINKDWMVFNFMVCIL